MPIMDGYTAATKIIQFCEMVNESMNIKSSGLLMNHKKNIQELVDNFYQNIGREDQIFDIIEQQK